MVSPAERAERSRLRRALHRIAAGLGLGVVLTGSLAAGVVLHLDLPPARRGIERVLRAALSGALEGEIDARGFEHVGLDGVALREVTVRAPGGDEVLRATGVRAEADVPAIVRSVLGDGELRLALPFVRIDAVDVLVEPNARGELGLAAAFRPRATEQRGPARPVHFTLAQAEIGVVHARGRPDGARAIDADARDVTAFVRVEPGSVAIDLAPVRVTERALLARPIEGAAALLVRLQGPKDEGDPAPSTLRLSASFAGRAGDVGVVAATHLEGRHLEVAAVVPRALPEQVRAIAPAYPLLDAVAVSATASGDLPTLDFQVKAITDRNGSAAAQGHVVLGRPLRADCTFSTDALDARVALATGPALAVTSRGKVHVDLGTLVFVRVDAATDATSLGGTPVPATEATAVFDGIGWSGSAKIHEPGAPTRATFSTTQDGGVRFDVTADVPSLAKAPRLQRARLSGAASVHAAGTFRGGVLDAAIDGQVRSLGVAPGVTVERAAVKGRVNGALGALAVDATVTAAEAHAGGYGAESATVHVKGPVLRPAVRAHVIDFRHNVIDASATVDAKAAAAERIQLRVERDGAVTSGRIARVGPRGGVLAIEGVAIESPDFGAIAGSLRVSGGELLGDLRADGVDLAAVRKFLGLPRALEGRADIAVSLARAKGGRTGTVHVALRDAGADVVPALFVGGVSAQLDATFTGDRVQASGHVALAGRGGRCDGQIAKVRFEGGDGRLHGPLLAASTWEDVIGRVTIAADDWDLGCLAEATPIPLPLSEVFGIVSAKLTLDRPEKQRFPSIHGLTAVTRYLSLAGPERPADKPGASPAPPWSTRDVDVDLTGDLDGQTGEAALHVAFWDEALLANGSFFATLDLGALADGRTGPVAATPIAGRLTVPRRPIDALRTLPSFVRDNLPRLGGEAAADAYVAGTLASPRAVVRVQAWGLAPGASPGAEASPWTLPVDVDAAAAYDGDRAMLDAHVAHDGRSLARAEAALTVPLAKVLEGGPALAASIAGRAAVTVDGLPLGDLPAFGARAVRGDLRGTASLEGLGSEPRLTVDLDADGLKIGPDLTFPEARLSFRTQRGRPSESATALAAVHLADSAGGAFDATGSVDVDWRSGLVPVPRQDRPGSASARFRRFRLATAEPFLGGVVHDLDGFVDGDVGAGWGRLDDVNKATWNADLRIADARFHLPQLGQELRLSGDETGPLRVRADRDGTVRVEHLVARGTTGKVTGEAIAHLDGLAFRDATAKLAIAEGDALPITIEGALLGSVWGTLAFASSQGLDTAGRGKVLSVDLHSTDLHLLLPRSSSRDLQPLDKNPDIVVLQDRVPPPEPASPDGLALRFVARLENMVIEGDGMRVTLSTFEATPPTFVFGAAPQASGDIRLLRGTVEVMGRKFELDQGTVHLSNVVSNPYLDVTAHWDAPDGSTIFVDYSGTLLPITQNKLRFRSNPARTQQQAIAFLLFGSETGGELTKPSGDPSVANAGVGDKVGHAAADLGGDLAAAQFNALLKGIGPLKGLSTRLGSTDAGGMKTSLVYQVGDTLSAVATYEGGASTATPGTGSTTGSAGAAAPGAFVSVDWRFYKNWLIRATVGTSADVPKGEVDLLWQYRY